MPKKKGKKDKGPPVPVGDLNIFGPLLVIKQVLLKSNSPPHGRRALLPAQQHAPERACARQGSCHWCGLCSSRACD